MSINPPSAPTLKKYGLTEADWWRILESQGAVCCICKLVPSTGRLVIDHEHVKGWKKMPDAQRKLYVRGLLCWFCNHVYVGRGITIAKAQNVVVYLEQYAIRRPQ
jgi:hypothetical protein